MALASPEDGGAVRELYAQLSWTLVEGGTNVTYDVYFDHYQSLDNKVEDGYFSTTYNATGLEHGVTYFWKVVPVLPNGTRGTCQDEYRSFYVDITGRLTGWVYDITMEEIDDVYVQRGRNVDVTVRVKNVGEVYDKVRVEVDTGDLYAEATFLDENVRLLSPNQTAQFTIRLGTYPESDPGDFVVTVSATSEHAADVNSTVVVERSFTVTLGDLADDKGGSDTAEADEPDGVGMAGVVVAVAVIVALIGIFVTLFLLLRLGFIGKGKGDGSGERREDMHRSGGGEEELREF